MRFIFIIFYIFILSSCGVDTLKKSSSASSELSNQNTSVSCMCTTDYSPVCGTDKKSYENACLAKCFGNQSFLAGNCTCKTEVLVCGIDQITYNECEARSKNITITKYVPCNSNQN
jgi:hypothetical protein